MVFKHATNIYFADQGPFQMCYHQSSIQSPQIPVIEVRRSYSKVIFHLIPIRRNQYIELYLEKNLAQWANTSPLISDCASETEVISQEPSAWYCIDLSVSVHALKTCQSFSQSRGYTRTDTSALPLPYQHYNPEKL